MHFLFFFLFSFFSFPSPLLSGWLERRNLCKQKSQIMELDSVSHTSVVSWHDLIVAGHNALAAIDS